MHTTTNICLPERAWEVLQLAGAPTQHVFLPSLPAPCIVGVLQDSETRRRVFKGCLARRRPWSPKSSWGSTIAPPLMHAPLHPYAIKYTQASVMSVWQHQRYTCMSAYEQDSHRDPHHHRAILEFEQNRPLREFSGKRCTTAVKSGLKN